MFSRSLSFFVALACAALSTSAPIGGSPLNLVPTDLTGVTGTAPNVGLPVPLPPLPLPPVPRQLGALTNTLVAAADDAVSIVAVGVLGAVPLPALPSVRRQVDVGGLVGNLGSLVPRQVDVGGLVGNLGSLIPRQVDAGDILGSLSGLEDLVPRNPQVDPAEISDLLDVSDLLSDLPGLPVPRQLEDIGDDLQDLVLARQVEHPSLPEIFHGLVVKITPISNKLSAAVAVKAEIDADLVVGLFHDVIDLLTEAVAEVQYIIDNPAGFTLSLAGTVLSITQVARIIADLLLIVLPVLATVVGVVEGALASLVLPLIGTIGSLVGSLLSLALGLVPGLLAILLSLIQSLIATIYYLRLADVISILGLAALA